jgi:hypothetical protein
MAKTYREGQMITGKAVDNRKVPLGTVIRYEPSTGWVGAASMLTVGGWVRQDGRFIDKGYWSSEKLFRILSVGDGEPSL